MFTKQIKNKNSESYHLLKHFPSFKIKFSSWAYEVHQLQQMWGNCWALGTAYHRDHNCFTIIFLPCLHHLPLAVICNLNSLCMNHVAFSFAWSEDGFWCFLITFPYYSALSPSVSLCCNLITPLLPLAFQCCAPDAQHLSSFLPPRLGFPTAFNQERGKSRKV